jgi:site-specific recombinase XerD
MTPPRRQNTRWLTLAISEWPDNDRCAWEGACRPGSRLKPGGRASHLAEVSRDNLERRYGGFLKFLQLTDRLETNAAAAAQVTPANVEAYVKELIPRVVPVSVYTYICCLRQTAQLLAPATDFSWLTEIERDLALFVEPRSKFDRLVSTERLVTAGLALIIEGMESPASDVARAVRVRNGLAIALLAVCPIRIKNFAALQIGTTFKLVDGRWWITLPSITTKNRRPDERPVPDYLNRYIEIYLTRSRPVLLQSGSATNALWISSTTGRPVSRVPFGNLITKITLETTGVPVSPHLFRTAAVTTAVTHGGSTPHLASALLNHRDPRVTEEHYNRASSISASKVYAEITAGFMLE